MAFTLPRVESTDGWSLSVVAILKFQGMGELSSMMCESQFGATLIGSHTNFNGADTSFHSSWANGVHRVVQLSINFSVSHINAQ
jgi:hypothetical protein